MSEGSWIVIPGWEEFQHRDAARSMVPPWIKVYTELMSKEEFLELSFHLRGVLISVWLEYAASKRQLRDNTVTLTRRLGHRVTRRELDLLSRAGLLAFSASNPASRPAGLEVEKRREESLSKDIGRARAETAERENPRNDNSRGPGWVDNLSRYTGCRLVRGTHGFTHKHDPLGIDPTPENWPHPRPTRTEIAAALERAHA